MRSIAHKGVKEEKMKIEEGFNKVQQAHAERVLCMYAALGFGPRTEHGRRRLGMIWDDMDPTGKDLAFWRHIQNGVRPAAPVF